MIDVVAFAVTPDPIGANSVSGYGFGGYCIEIKGADLYLDPPSFIVIELIVPFAATIAVANPTVGLSEEIILILLLLPSALSSFVNSG